MAYRGRTLSALARVGLQRLLNERGSTSAVGGHIAVKYAAPMTTTSSALSFFPPLSSRAAFSAGAPLPQVEEEEDIKAMPRPSTPTSKSKPSGFALNGALPPPLGRAPTAATAAFALASSSRPSACDRVDLATKLLDANHAMSTPTYTREYLESVRPTHLKPESFRQKLAYAGIQLVRRTFDFVTGYNPHGPNPESRWLRRMLFLETVAGVPGMVGGSLRHLRSLRMLRYDGGRINTLLDESENERMHLMTFLELGERKGPLFRAAVVAAQGIMWNLFFLLYLASPNTAHAFVGFLEEEAVKTYTHALAEIDAGRLWPVDGPVKPPAIAIAYWNLPESASMRDVILAIRADEAAHAHVNHIFSILHEDDPNPFAMVHSREGEHACSAATAAELEVVAEAEVEKEKKNA